MSYSIVVMAGGFGTESVIAHSRRRAYHVAAIMAAARARWTLAERADFPPLAREGLEKGVSMADRIDPLQPNHVESKAALEHLNSVFKAMSESEFVLVWKGE